MALFEVWQGRKCVMSTNSEVCIYGIDTLKKMKTAGYTFKMNGKPYNPTRRGKNEKVDMA